VIQRTSSIHPPTKISEPTPSGQGSEIFFVPKPAPRILLVASIAWTIWNYRLSLIQALESAGYEVILLATEDASCTLLAQHTKARFIPLRQLSRRSLSPLQNLRALLEMYRIMARLRPDAALLFTIRPNTLGNLAAALAGVPGISTVEGMGLAGGKKGWFRWFSQFLYRCAFRHASKVVFLNREDQQIFVEQGILSLEKAVFIHGPGIDLQHFRPREKVKNFPEMVFLFVARLLSEKGIREFVEAARLLKIRGINAVFRVLGDTDAGNPTTISLAELKTWEQEGIVQTLGFLDDVRPAIAEADVMVLPSYYREGVPRSVLEAMAMEKPIITTDNVGCRDTVEEGKNGFLIPARNAAALADAMEKIVHLTPDQRAAMGRASRQIVEQKFGDAWVLPRYLALIQEVLRQ
jgi:glycosyltransferase involved in cell wall biosynthesis